MKSSFLQLTFCTISNHWHKVTSNRLTTIPRVWCSFNLVCTKQSHKKHFKTKQSGKVWNDRKNSPIENTPKNSPKYQLFYKPGGLEFSFVQQKQTTKNDRRSRAIVLRARQQNVRMSLISQKVKLISNYFKEKQKQGKILLTKNCSAESKHKPIL